MFYFGVWLKLIACMAQLLNERSINLVFRNQQLLLKVWRKNDAFFPERGAAAFKKDVKEIDYNIYDTGYFAS